MDELEMCAAVVECVARARRAATPDQAIEEFVQHLHVWRDWPPEDAGEIGRRVRQVTARKCLSRTRR